MDKTSYIIQYPDGELSVSYGIISNISEDNKYQFQHKFMYKKRNIWFTNNKFEK